MSEILDIVNEQDKVIGQADRDEVHRTGLLCRLIYVWFYTPDGEILLQKRSITKKNDPGKLTSTVSGHVGSGQTIRRVTTLAMRFANYSSTNFPATSPTLK